MMTQQPKTTVRSGGRKGSRWVLPLVQTVRASDAGVAARPGAEARVGGLPLNPGTSTCKMFDPLSPYGQTSNILDRIGQFLASGGRLHEQYERRV